MPRASASLLPNLRSSLRFAAAMLGCVLAACNGSGGGRGNGGGGSGNATVGPSTLANQVLLVLRGFPGSGQASGIAVADVDGDGDRDVFFGSQLYRNDGGAFELAAGSLPDYADHAAFGDVDGDSDLDLFVSRGTSRLWLNDGTGVFTDVTEHAFAGNANDAAHVALGDIDGDLDLDAVVGTRGIQDRVFRNNGAGVFTDVTSAWLPAGGTRHQIALADFDGDGDPDLLARNGTMLLRNTGQAFVADPTANLPIGGGQAIAVADLDGDLDLDVVMSRNWSTPQTNVLLLNDGAGHFTDLSAQFPQAGHGNEMASVTVGDVDGDGDPDVVIADQGRLLLNDGAANFTAAPTGHLPSLVCYAHVQLAELDGDGDLDLVLATAANFDCPFPQPAQLLANDGQGRFRAAPRRRGPIDGIAADIDGDLDLDVIANTFVDRNDGTGAFTLSAYPPGPFTPETIGPLLAVGDVDGDGAPDAVFGYQFEVSGAFQNRVYRNDGTGAFTAIPHPAIGETSSGDLGDVDGDGDLDLVFGRASPPALGRQTMLLTNDGHGAFTNVTATRLPVDGEQTTDVAFGDVDRDGDLDLVLASRAQHPNTGRIRLYSNDGAGAFSDVTLERVPGSRMNASGIVVVDVEGDGDLDILISATSGPSWYRNRGDGVFTDASSNLPFGTQNRAFHAAQDLDGDGDIDLAVFWESGVSFFLQDAPGQFRQDQGVHLPMMASPLVYPTVVAIDVDGDSDFEWGGRTNLARHLLAPGPATLGRSWRLDAYAKPGWLARDQVAQIHVSLAAATLPVAMPPYGVFRLDPSASVTLPPLVIPAPAGRASVGFPIPNDPVLLSQPVHAQALITDPGSGAGHFTNLHSETIGS